VRPLSLASDGHLVTVNSHGLFSVHVHSCVSSSSYKVQKDYGPPLMTSFNLNHLFKGPIHIQPHWNLALQPVSFRGTKFSP